MSPDFIRVLDAVCRERPRASDAIVWLQGDRYDRAEKTHSLFIKNWAPMILLSGNNILLDSDARLDEDNVSLLNMKQWLLDHEIPASAILIDDQAMNTHDQAARTVRLALKSVGTASSS